MGSHPESSPASNGGSHLTLTHPTASERTGIWASTHPQWGAALSLPDYLRREAYLQTVPVSKDGGITQWILTDPSLGGGPDDRPILSSCESIRKRALVAHPDGTVREVVAHGIGSVFTDPQFRGKGYASKMMGMLGPRLRDWNGVPFGQAPREGGSEKKEVAFSVLFSDIGKSFYAKQGWHPHASAHLSFRPEKTTTTTTENHQGAPAASATPVGYHELAELCCVDEKLLRARLAQPASSGIRVALIPDLDAILWHLMREDFMTKHIFGKTPTVRGAVFGEPGRRVWAVWTRGYYGGLQTMEGNTLHVLRFVIEDEACDDEYLVAAIAAVIRLAQHEATEWNVAHLEMWNPDARLRSLVDRTGIQHEFVDREKDSIASLMFYGEGDVDWMANEKFGWC